MGMARLDPSPWNLGAPLVGMIALGACGPLVPIDDTSGNDESTSNSTTNGSNSNTNPTGPNPTGPNPTGPNPTTITTSPGGCYDVPCPPNYHCENGYCVYDGCYYDDGGCCYDTCCGFECGWYGECYSNVECPSGYFCEYNYCQGAPQEPECAIVTLDFQIPIPGGGAVQSLAFVDANGDAQRDLVIGQAGSVQLVDGASLSVSDIDAGVNAEHLATGDLDGDGDGDIAMANAAVGGGVRILMNIGGWLPVDIAGGTQNLTGIALGDVEGDGFPDIWAWSSSEGTYIYFNSDGMVSSAQGVFDIATSLAVGNADGDGLQDTALYSYQPYVLTDGAAFNAWGLWDGSNRTERIITMANFNNSDYDDIVVLQAVNGITLSSSWAGPVIESSPYHSWWATTVTDAVSSDMNNDGYVDIVASAAGSPITIAYGAPEAPPDVINCVQYVASPITAAVTAVGDITGDGRADIAVSDGVSVFVMAQSG
ncbi:MAG TPA: VCBS repeat-containing protein [Nannocystaceae bacterium]|nr:VCBS repeat-containing protein [Nannocystaceae bacterium]